MTKSAAFRGFASSPAAGVGEHPALLAFNLRVAPRGRLPALRGDVGNLALLSEVDLELAVLAANATVARAVKGAMRAADERALQRAEATHARR